MTAENVKKIFIFLANCQIGTYCIQRQSKHGKPRASFTKDHLPDDKQSEKYITIIDFLKEFDLTAEEYGKCLEGSSESSITSLNNATVMNDDTTSVMDQ